MTLRAFMRAAVVTGIVGLGPAGCSRALGSLELWSVPSPASVSCKALVDEVESRGINARLVEGLDDRYGESLLARGETWVMKVERRRSSTLPEALAATFAKHRPRVTLTCGPQVVRLPVRVCKVRGREHWIVDARPLPATMGAAGQCALKVEQSVGRSARNEGDTVVLRPSLRALIEVEPAP